MYTQIESTGQAERTPLLHSAHARRRTQPNDADSRSQTTLLHVLIDMGALGKATLPIAISFAVQNIVQAFSIMMAGRLGAFELDVAS